MAENVTGFRVDANINPFEDSMRRMVDAARKGQAGVGSSFSSINDGLLTLKTSLLAIPALMTGGLVGSIIQSADALDELSEKTGVSVKSLVGLQYAAKMGGASSETLTASLRNLSKNISEAGQGNKELTSLFQQLGIKATDASGNLRKADDVLTDLADVFPRLQEADRVAVAMQLLGKAGMDMIPMLTGGRNGLEAMVAEGQRLNPITEDLAKKAGQFNDNLDKIGMTIRSSLYPAIEELLPVVNNLSNEMLVGTRVFGGYWSAMMGAGTVSPFRDNAEQVKVFKEEVADLESALKRYKAARSDTSGIEQALSLSRKRLQYFKELQALEAERNSNVKLGPSFVFPDATSTKQIKLTGPEKDTPKKQREAKEPSQMPVYEAELSKRIALFEKEAQAQGTLRKYSQKEEAAYWKEVSERAGITAEDKARAEKKWRDIERGLRSEAFSVEMADLSQRKSAAENNFGERIKLAEQAYAKTVAMYGAESKEAASAYGEVLQEKRNMERNLRAELFAVEMADLEQRKQATQNNYAERINLAEQAHKKTVAMYGAESKEAATAYGNILDEKRKLEQQNQQIEDIANQRRQEKALTDIELERLNAEHKVSMGLMTQEQLVAQELQFQERMYAIKLSYLQQLQAAKPESEDRVRYAELKGQIEQLEMQHQLRMQGIRKQIALQQAGPELNIFRSMESAFEQAATGILMRAQTLQQALGNIFKSVYTVFVQEMVSKPLAMAAVRVIRESALYKTIAGTQISSQAAASGAVVAAKAGETAAVVGANATQAATGAAASQASIPWIGPALAFAAAASMMSFVLGLGSKGNTTTTTTTRIPSASGGFDIPRGLNPMTQLHEEEMVLPAHIANPLRESLAQGPAAGQGGDSPPVVIHTTGGDFIHKRDLAKLLTTMKRDFRFQT